LDTELLSFVDLTVHFGRAVVLKEISGNIEFGQIVAMIGANGAGKSTLLKAIIGLVRLFSGEISFRGKRIDGTPPQVIVGLGISLVPEGRQLFSEMTVLENLEMGAYLRKNRREVALSLEDILVLFPVLRQRKNQLAASLSGGEQQMLALGRAMMKKPSLLLVDELSLGLAPLVVKQLSKTLVKINKEEGIGILLVEQNARLALGLADHGYVLETGKIVLEGRGADLLQNEAVKRAYLGG